MAPDTTSEKVENATSTRASPTGQRRRSHSPAQPSAPATTSAVNSQPGGSVDDSRRPPITSSPKITATRNSRVSTTQSRGRRRGLRAAAVAVAVAEGFIPGSVPARGAGSAAGGQERYRSHGGRYFRRTRRSRRPIRRHRPVASVRASAHQLTCHTGLDGVMEW